MYKFPLLTEKLIGQINVAQELVAVFFFLFMKSLGISSYLNFHQI